MQDREQCLLHMCCKPTNSLLYRTDNCSKHTI